MSMQMKSCYDSSANAKLVLAFNVILTFIISTHCMGLRGDQTKTVDVICDIFFWLRPFDIKTKRNLNRVLGYSL